MGNGIAQVLAQEGFSVILIDVVQRPSIGLRRRCRRAWNGS
jgi:3-hydroxyacyl-CoA dehydrogenase